MKWFSIFVFVLSTACARSNDAALDDTPAPAKPGSCTLRFERAGLCAEPEWMRLPTETAEGELLIKFSSAPSQTVEVRLWMPDMGHGSKPAKVTSVDNATFRATELSFFMKGHWDVHVELRDGRGVFDEATLRHDLN